MAMWSMTTLVAPVAGPAARRLDHRQHLLAVDLLHQHPGRPDRRGGHAGRSTASARRGSRKLPIDDVGLGAARAVGRRAADHARQGQGARLVRLDPDRHARRRRGGRLRLLPRLGADRGAPGRRPAPVRAAQLPGPARSRSRSPTACSSATSCCCRCGCSSTWATPRPRPAWSRRRSACWRSCSRPWSARTSARSTRGATRPSPSSCSRWCCGCARTSTRRPTSARS